MEMILITSKVNTNEITCLSMKASMDNMTLVAESRSHMEQLVTPPQELFKWASTKIEPSKCCSLSMIKGNCREIKFSFDGNEIPTLCEKSTKNLSRCSSLPLTD